MIIACWGCLQAAGCNEGSELILFRNRQIVDILIKENLLVIENADWQQFQL